MPVCYNIPTTLLHDFRTEHVVLRSDQPGELAEALRDFPPENVRFVQLLSPDRDTEALQRVEAPVCIDLVVDDPQEFALLYRRTELFRTHPVRVTATAVPGFTKTVRLAMSLGLPVKLDVTHPDRYITDELLALLDNYLHHTTVSQPIEFFHGILMSLYSGNATTLWKIQEEDPAEFLFVRDSGEIALSRRLPVSLESDAAPNFVNHLRTKLISGQNECSACRFFSCCAGYFKLPDETYRCDHVLEVFSVIENAAAELRKDYAAYAESETESPT
ncbi:MAG TPA: hypothetical protein VK463_04465 [Desulfomonilaceae bacterium]|nr:hypothetical protein [Desulfomonilaceae bacterium]